LGKVAASSTRRKQTCTLGYIIDSACQGAHFGLQAKIRQPEKTMLTQTTECALRAVTFLSSCPKVPLLNCKRWLELAGSPQFLERCEEKPRQFIARLPSRWGNELIFRFTTKLLNRIELWAVGWKIEENQATLGPILNTLRYFAKSLGAGVTRTKTVVPRSVRAKSLMAATTYEPPTVYGCTHDLTSLFLDINVGLERYCDACS
jgi:hypothetical protein